MFRGANRCQSEVIRLSNSSQHGCGFRLRDKLTFGMLKCNCTCCPLLVVPRSGVFCFMALVLSQKCAMLQDTRNTALCFKGYAFSGIIKSPDLAPGLDMPSRPPKDDV